MSKYISKLVSGTESEEAETLLLRKFPADLKQKILDLSGVLQHKANIIRSEPPINWQPFLDGGMISNDDYSFLTSYQEAKTKEERDEVLNRYKDRAFTILATAVQRVSVVENIQKFLVLIDDMIWEDRSRLEQFKPALAESWKAFLDLLSCYQSFVRNMAARLISKFICVDFGLQSEASELKFYLTWLKNELQNDNKYLLSVARCIQRVLKVNEYRLPFFNIQGIFRIIRLLDNGTIPQAQYQLIFCIWLSSFNPEISEKLDKYPTIPILVDLLEACPGEIVKLPRIITATFRNLLEKPPGEMTRRNNALLMIQCKLMKFIDYMHTKNDKCNDEEFLEDIRAVEEIIKKYVAELSTFDEYRLQVISGSLEWSVVHTSQRFWKENAARLNENKYELLKKLVSLLETSNEVSVLCVAAHDLGEYMSHYMRGKQVVEELGGKDALLGLLSSENKLVKYHGLRSLQILMLDSYDLLIEHVTDSRSQIKFHEM